MISHKHHCIFIHIPRCAGSSIETWISGQDWWIVDPSTKHLLASQAKALYAEFWDKYFKFSVVRHPVDRVASCLKYADYFGLSLDECGVSFADYHNRFGRETVVEHDHRFHRRSELLRPGHKPCQIYGNILDEELDFVARLESLESDLNIVQRQIGKKGSFTGHFERYAEKGSMRERLLSRDIAYVESMYAADLARYSYY